MDCEKVRNVPRPKTDLPKAQCETCGTTRGLLHEDPVMLVFWCHRHCPNCNKAAKGGAAGKS